jgi:hypothetical protein
VNAVRTMITTHLHPAAGSRWERTSSEPLRRGATRSLSHHRVYPMTIARENKNEFFFFLAVDIVNNFVNTGQQWTSLF